MSKCQGCGVELQTENPKLIGYTPKANAKVCQRCFRLTHYNDSMVSMQEGIATQEVFDKVADLDALVCYVVDLFDFEAGLLPSLNRQSLGKDIVLVATKRDLLPKTTGYDKIVQFIRSRTKEMGMDIKGIVLCSDLVHHAKSEENESIQGILDAFEACRNGKDVVIMGMANAGKSTLINALIQKQQVTTSAHPGTTLDCIPIAFDDFTLFDTPGLLSEGSVLTYLNESHLKQVIPQKTIKPLVYQLKGNQSLSIGGLARFDLMGCENVSVTTYFSNELKVHRSKAENSEELWNKHLGELLSPTISSSVSELKTETIQGKVECHDICVHGLGFICVKGNVKQVKVTVDKRVNVTVRKAMI